MKKKIKYIRFAVLFLCTIIAVYGILNAPKSDQKELEDKLNANEQMLAEKNDTTPAPSAVEQIATNVPASAAPSAVAETPAPKKTISVIGDSVFLGAAPAFMEMYEDAVIDAKVSRQVSQAKDIAKKLDKKGKLGNTIIISLGTNGPFNEATGQELIDYLGTDRTIYWINAYGKNLDIQKDVNDTIDKLIDKNDNVHLIDWAKYAKKHSDWFYQDGIHLNTDGQEGFSKFVSKKIEN